MAASVAPGASRPLTAAAGGEEVFDADTGRSLRRTRAGVTRTAPPGAG